MAKRKDDNFTPEEMEDLGIIENQISLFNSEKPKRKTKKAEVSEVVVSEPKEVKPVKSTTKTAKPKKAETEKIAEPVKEKAVELPDLTSIKSELSKVKQTKAYRLKKHL